MRLKGLKSTSSRGSRAFTLVEAMIVSVTLVIVISAVIMANLFGLSMAARQQIWLGASDDAARAVGTLMGDIRSSVTLQVGTFSSGTFTTNAATVQQSGNALMIATNNTILPAAPYILYYYDSVSNNLVRSNYYGAGTSGDFKLVSANPITNDSTHPIFTEVDYTGTPLSNSTPVASINLYLSFTKLQNPQVEIQSGSIVDLYQIITTVSPRIKL